MYNEQLLDPDFLQDFLCEEDMVLNSLNKATEHSMLESHDFLLVNGIQSASSYILI